MLGLGEGDDVRGLRRFGIDVLGFGDIGWDGH
jgi:hypothetical protein